MVGSCWKCSRWGRRKEARTWVQWPPLTMRHLAHFAGVSSTTTPHPLLILSPAHWVFGTRPGSEKPLGTLNPVQRSINVFAQDSLSHLRYLTNYDVKPYPLTRTQFSSFSAWTTLQPTSSQDRSSTTDTSSLAQNQIRSRGVTGNLFSGSSEVGFLFLTPHFVGFPSLIKFVRIFGLIVFA